MASINHLAEELIFQILSWLPVLSLLRCKSVCKSWKSIISNPNFIQAHLAISNKKQHPFSLIRVVAGGVLPDLFVDSCGEDSVKLTLPAGFASVMPQQVLVRSCNGLVTLSDIHVGVLYIWNPLTRFFKLLPEPRINDNPQRIGHLFSFEFVENYGFGFDSVSNDYKIVRVVLGICTVAGDETSGIVAELYSVNADSWTAIQVPEEMRGFRQDLMSECVCVDNRVLCFEGTNGILLFDLEDEVFRGYNYPRFGVRMSDPLDFEGSIAFILKSSERESILRLWMLDEVGGKFIWILKFIIEPHMKIDHVLFYLGDGQFLAEDYDGGCFVYDDRKKGAPLPCVLGEFISVARFSGSLLSLEGFEQQV